MLSCTLWALGIMAGIILFFYALYWFKLNVSFNKKPPLQGEFIKLKDYSLFYTQHGNPNAKQTLLFVHGFQSSHYFFHKNIDFFKKDMQVIALDLLGCGFSDKPLDFNYQFQTYAHVIKEFLDAKKIDKVIYVGHSMGGGVGLAFASLYPEKLEKLVAIAPANPYDLESLMNFEKMLNKGVFFALTVLDNIFLSKKTYENRICYKQKIPFKELKKITAHKWTKNGRKAALKIVKSGGIEDVARLKEGLLNICVPVLLVYGLKDKIVNAKKGPLLAQNIAQAKLVSFENEGHSPHYENPEEFHKTLLHWFGEG